MEQKKYKFLQFKDFSYNEALNNYADMQNYLRDAISQAYDKAYSGSDYNKHKDILEQILKAKDVFEYSETRSGKKVANFPTEAELKKLDKHFVDSVRDAQKTTETFMKIIKEHYNVKNRDEFSDMYGTDVRLDRTANAAADKWKLTKSDREKEEKRHKYLEAQSQLKQKIAPNMIKTESMKR